MFVTQSGPSLCDSMDYDAMEFSRQQYWSGQPTPSAGDLPNPGNLHLLHCRLILFCLSHQGGPNYI